VRDPSHERHAGLELPQNRHQRNPRLGALLGVEPAPFTYAATSFAAASLLMRDVQLTAMPQRFS